MSNSGEHKKDFLSNIILVAKQPFLLQILKRVTRHIAKRQATQVSSIYAAEAEMLRDEPDAVIIDVSDFDSAELERKVSPFVLRIPGWVKTFFVDKNPTPSRIKRAKNMGVNGVIKAPLSHHGITMLLHSLEAKGPGDEKPG